MAHSIREWAGSILQPSPLKSEGIVIWVNVFASREPPPRDGRRGQALSHGKCCAIERVIGSRAVSTYTAFSLIPLPRMLSKRSGLTRSSVFGLLISVNVINIGIWSALSAVCGNGKGKDALFGRWLIQ